jgi:hypothetical protein
MARTTEVTGVRIDKIGRVSVKSDSMIAHSIKVW